VLCRSNCRLQWVSFTSGRGGKNATHTYALPEAISTGGRGSDTRLGGEREERQRYGKNSNLEPSRREKSNKGGRSEGLNIKNRRPSQQIVDENRGGKRKQDSTATMGAEHLIARDRKTIVLSGRKKVRPRSQNKIRSKKKKKVFFLS